MANEVEIVVKSKDKTDYGPAKTKAKTEGAKIGDEAGQSFSTRMKRWFTKSGEESGKGFGTSVKRWFTGDGGGLFTEIGKSGGTVFGSGFLGALKTPILGPAIAGILTAIVLTTLPAVGAIAAGALVTGFGAGLAGLGIVFAAKSKAVGDTWRRTMAQTGADMRLLSKPFESTLIHIAGYFERTVDKFNPHLAKSFSKMAPVVDKFVDGAARSLERLIPVISPVTDAFGEVLDSLGPAFDSAIADLAAGFTDLAESVRQNPEALADTVRGIGDLVRTGLQLVQILNDVNGGFEDLTGGTSLVDVTMRGLQATLAPLIGLFTALEKGIGLVNAMTHSTEASGASMREAGLQVAAAAEAYQKQGNAAKGTIAPTQTAAEKQAELAKKAAEATARFEAQVTALFKLQNQFLTLSGAAIGVEAAIDAASASVKENGKTLDITTEKGRANRTALESLAKAANDQTESMIRAGKSNVTAAGAAEHSRANFVKLAVQMGATVPEAKRMAAQMIAIPNVSRTAKLTANKKDLETKLAAAKRELASKDLTKERRAQLNADIKRLERGIANAKAALASVPNSKTVTITTRQVTIRAIVNQTATGGGRAPGHWAGGTGVRGFASGGTTPRQFIAGEYGPEIVELNGSDTARVTPHGNSMRRMRQEGAGSGGGPSVVQLVIDSAGSMADQLLLKWFQQAVQARGGNVQLVVGGRTL